MSASERWGELKAGFEPAFWVANFTELFERLAYYAQSAVLAIFLDEALHCRRRPLTGTLMGVFGFAVWFLPIWAGAWPTGLGFADRCPSPT